MGNNVYVGLAVTSSSVDNDDTTDDLAAATFSEVEITGNVSGDWQVVNIGDDEQAEGSNTIDILYVSIEDSSGNRYTVYAPANAIGSGEWMEWLIPYSEFDGVNMTKVKKIALGVADEAGALNGSGIVYIDNIGLGTEFE